MSPDQLRTKIARVKKELKTLVLSLADVSEEDPFSFLSGWSLLPRVDKTGLYQLVVKADSRAKCALATLTNNFRVAKTLEGEEETILLVSHVLEFILFTECISTEFSVERGHSWQSKQSGTFQHKKVGPVNRCFRVKVNDVQFRKLSPAVKQFNLNILLNQFGRVIQLEQNSFGVPNNFLVVFSGNHKLDISGVEAGSGDPSLLELFPDTLPDHYIPNYGVDQHGFYSLVGKFPLGTSLGVRRKFKDSMEEIGAVGFREGESEDDFTLHFVTSRSIEQLSKFPQYSNFIIRIQSSLLRAPRPQKKVVNMIPSILKLKEIQNKASSLKPVVPTPESGAGLADVVNEDTEKSSEELSENNNEKLEKSDEDTLKGGEEGCHVWIEGK